MTDSAWHQIEALLRKLAEDLPQADREAWMAKAAAGFRDVLVRRDDDDDDVEQRARAAARQRHERGDDACVVCQVVLQDEVPVCHDCSHSEDADDAEWFYLDEMRKLGDSSGHVPVPAPVPVAAPAEQVRVIEREDESCFCRLNGPGVPWEWAPGQCRLGLCRPCRWTVDHVGPSCA